MQLFLCTQSWLHAASQKRRRRCCNCRKREPPQFSTCASPAPEDALKIVPVPPQDTKEAKLPTHIASGDRSIPHSAVFYCLLVCCIVITGIGILFVVDPSPCEDVPECLLALAADSASCDSTPRGRVAALSVLLAKELSSLVAVHHDVQHMQGVASGIPNRRDACATMCITIAIKTVSELAFAFGYTWPFAVPPTPGLLEDWGFVHAVRYVSWMLTVPLLLVLCCHYVLRRPMSEVIGPIVAADLSMYLAGTAMVASKSTTRILFLLVVFALYCWASFKMMQWAYRFLCDTSPKVPRRRVRVLFCLGILLLSWAYGIVYLLAITGTIGSDTESEFYSRADVFCKISVSFVVANVGEAERQHILREVMFQCHDLSSACLSVLRGKFDHVLPCSLDQNHCLSIDVDAQGAEYLEALLGRPVTGVAFHELIATEQERTRFEAYTQRTLQNDPCSPRPAPSISRSWSQDSAGLSQSLEMPLAAMANAFWCDLVGRSEYDNGLTDKGQWLPRERLFSANIYLSAVNHRPATVALPAENRMVIALNVKEVRDNPSFESLPSSIPSPASPTGHFRW